MPEPAVVELFTYIKMPGNVGSRAFKFPSGNLL
jgi:hypothetical protein